MKKAVFSLANYHFNHVSIDLNNASKEDVSVNFNPTGIFYISESKYELRFDFTAFDEQTGIDNPYVKINCVAIFKFDNISTLEEIPPYFYKNSIAIVFPFIRAFVSSVTLQANVKVIVLPTMNLSSLEQSLIEGTTVK